jgi:hypothetical protein
MKKPEVKTKQKRSVPDFLEEAAELFAERNAVYADAYKRVGSLFTAWFPDGITLNTEHDFNRFAILIHLANKMTRYASNWDHGHDDSLEDLIVYPAMLKEIDHSDLGE